ncbi:MAG: gamma-glutamyltransferase [Acidobacteria bacterium]|nr:gamma-glutamyltransferase [Acidobacteriota bacterium]
MSKSRLILFLLMISLIIISLIPVNKIYTYSIEPETARNGMVVSASEYASRVGVEVLKKGGNAVDAAVAVAFSLAVVYPTAGNIGGGGFMLIRTGDGGVYALDYREMAPQQVSESIYRNEDGKVNFDKLQVGYLAAGVPGTVKGMWVAHQKFGKLKWADLLQPAITAANDGFSINQRTAESLNQKRPLFERFPASSIFVSKRESGWIIGDIIRQPELAETLKRIQEQGERDFYQGQTAKILTEEMKACGGLITMEDLAGYKIKWREPLHFKYRGYDIYTMPPPSSGGIVIAQVLRILENSESEDIKYDTSAYYHLLAEAMKVSFRDRAVFMGDPDFVDVPISKLLDENYLKGIARNIKPDKLLSLEADEKHLYNVSEPDETTHFTIIDQWGNCVSNTYTLNGGYGSKAVVKGTGILLNNQMDDFSVGYDAPNMYNLVGSKKNSIEPGKRMLSSMSPTICVKDGERLIGLGSPGGPKIISSVLQALINVTRNDMNIREAIIAPRIHHQWFPDKLYMEDFGFSPETVDSLTAIGHNIELKGYFGCVNIADYLYEEKLFRGASDPRLDGKAFGY